MNLKAILAKDPTTLSAEEKAFLVENADSLTAEQKTAFAVAPTTEKPSEEVVDDEALKSLISKSIQEKIDAMAEGIAQKFLSGVSAQRAKAFAGEKIEKDANADETRKFMKALFTNDLTTLNAYKAKDVSGASDGAGAWLIPPMLQAEVLRIAQKQYGLARRDFRYLPFSGPGNSRTIPALSGNVTVTWTGEGVKKTPTAPTFTLVTQTLKKLAAIVPMTDEIIEDSAINLTQLISELFAEAVAKEEDLQFFNGTGSPWTGIVNNGSVNVVNLAAGSTTGAGITADVLLSMIDATPTGVLAGAKFYMHRTVMSALRVLKASSSGVYILQDATVGTPYNTLWGYPVELTDAMPTLASASSASKPLALFGNLGIAAIFGDKQQLRVKLLDQATVTSTDGTTPINLAEQDMSAIRIVERVGYVLAIPTAVTVLKTAVS